MQINRFLYIIYFLHLFLFSYSAYPNNLILFAENSPLTIKKKENSAEGLAGDILTEALKLANIKNKYQIVWVPWRRALFEASTKKDVYIVPIGDSKENKKNFNLFFKIYTDDVYIFTLKPQKEIKKLGDLKQLKSIGFIAGGPYEDIAKTYKFANRMESSSHGDYVVAKLIAKRIDGFITTGVLGSYKLTKSNIPEGKFRRGISLGKMNWYFGTNINSDSIETENLKNALISFKKSPKYLEIFKRYGITYSTN